jgi:DNA repair exonuclease SbcCD ATPase subunit
MSANAKHGARRTNADKRHAVLMALEDEEYKRLSDHEIAELCRVTQPFVSKIRKELGDNGYHSDQPSPKPQPDSEIARLKKEIEARDALEKEMEAALNEAKEKVATYQDVMTQIRRAPAPKPVVVEKVVEKPIVSPELEERVRRKEAELDAAMKALEEKSQLEEVADRVNRESMEERYRLQEEALQKKLAEKVEEMDAAAKAGLEVTELQKQKERLNFEIANLKNDLEYETHVERIRKYFRKVESGVVDTLRVVELLNEKILQDPMFCRFTFEEMVSVRDDVLHMHEATGEAGTLLDQLLAQMREGLNLHVVQ